MDRHTRIDGKVRASSGPSHAQRGTGSAHFVLPRYEDLNWHNSVLTLNILKYCCPVSGLLIKQSPIVVHHMTVFLLSSVATLSYHTQKLSHTLISYVASQFAVILTLRAIIYS